MAFVNLTDVPEMEELIGGEKVLITDDEHVEKIDAEKIGGGGEASSVHNESGSSYFDIGNAMADAMVTNGDKRWYSSYSGCDIQFQYDDFENDVQTEITLHSGEIPALDFKDDMKHGTLSVDFTDEPKLLFNGQPVGGDSSVFAFEILYDDEEEMIYTSCTGRELADAILAGKIITAKCTFAPYKSVVFTSQYQSAIPGEGELAYCAVRMGAYVLEDSYKLHVLHFGTAWTYDYTDRLEIEEIMDGYINLTRNGLE